MTDILHHFAQTHELIADGLAILIDGLPIGAGLEDLGKGLRSMTGTIFSTKAKGVRYLELTEGYITKVAVDENTS